MNNTKPGFQQNNERIKAAELARWLLSRGVSSVTTADIAALLAVPMNQVPQRLAPLKKRGEIVLLAHGLWAPVPPEYLTWGAPPAMDVVDALMRHFALDYYVGWLSAAALHGASHHAPQVFQVAVSRAVRAKTIGRSEFRFFQRSHVRLVAIDEMESRNGAVRVSNRETTMLDIASDIGYVGGIDNAANLITEMC
ncbi:MAG: type IV toxin-antitoxin system AbiEi family antitoxin, partial [Lachnospiraceae bacterium]|nr:type IV toxin-antitoxin system AbiEi family antitoxin [Lachnospiraceae bacterium]